MINIRKTSRSINGDNRCHSLPDCCACSNLSVWDRAFNGLDALSNYLIGFVVGTIFFALTIFCNPLIQKIIHAEQDSIEQQFLVTCKSNDAGKVYCVAGDGK